MLKKFKTGNAEFKSGVFIILSLVLLLMSVLWLRYFAITPAKKIIVKFNDPGPVASGMPVYYQGVNVGKVPKVGFSDNFKYVYVYVDIYNKELKLPSNIDATVKTEGITGQKYVNLSYPDEPSDRLLATGDIIDGEQPVGMQDFGEIYVDVQQTLTNANATTEKIGRTSDLINKLMIKYDKDLGTILKTASLGVGEFNHTMRGVNKVVNSEEMQQDLKEVVSSTNKLVQGTEANSQNVFDQIEKNQLIPKMSLALDETTKVAERFDCVGKNTSLMLNQKYLLFKLLFGNPGECLSECENFNK